MRVLRNTDNEIRVRVELTGRELQIIQRALADVPTDNADMRAEEGFLAAQFADLRDAHEWISGN